MDDYNPTSRRPIAEVFRATAHQSVLLCLRLGFSADMVSYSSVVAAGAAAACFWQAERSPALLLLGAAFCYLRLWCNMLDGMVALAAKSANLRGELLNDLPDYKAQAAALAWMLGPAAERAADLLDDHLDSAAAILDVGAGSAIWSLTLARRTSGRRVTAIDWTAVLEVAADYARQFGLGDRFEAIAGNFHEVQFPICQSDLAILANVTHLETQSGNATLFGKLRQALRPGGSLVIIDVFPGLAEGDLNRTLYALGLALRTEHGRVYTPAELETLLLEAGFSSVKLVNLATPPYVIGLMTARPE